jgi:hypothetical protein
MPIKARFVHWWQNNIACRTAKFSPSRRAEYIKITFNFIITCQVRIGWDM